MEIAQALLCVILVVLAAVHLLWALGIWFPLRDEASLARAATGFPGAVTMPGPVPCAVVATLLMMGAAAPYWPDGILRMAILCAMAAVFILRGLASYTAAWRRLTPQEPFATLDRKAFGPLCLFLGLLSVLAL